MLSLSLKFFFFFDPTLQNAQLCAPKDYFLFKKFFLLLVFLLKKKNGKTLAQSGLMSFSSLDLRA